MVGQITSPPARIASVTATSAVQPASPSSEPKTPTYEESEKAEAADVASAKTRILQLQAHLRTVAIKEADPKSASAQISRLAQEIDATAREYAAEGGDMPIAGVPARSSPLVAQSLARSGLGDEAPKTGIAVDIRV